MQTLNPSVTTGFLDPADFDLLFDLAPALTGGETEQDRVRNRRMKLAKAFMPFLQQRLIRQFVVQTMTAHTGADPVLAESLLTDERLLAGPKPLLEAFTATGERGVSASFFDSVDGSGVPQAISPIVMSADTAMKDKKDTNGNPLNPANSARFEGYLEVPTPGAYRFYVALDKKNAEAELRFDHLPDSVFLSGAAAADNAVLGDQPSEFLELKPGIPYRFTLTLKKLNGGEARLLVQGETLPKESVSQLTLYPLTAIQAAERAVLLLTKALQLAQSLGLNERELRYLLTHAADFGGLNLSQLPTLSSDDTPAEKVAAAERFAQFLRMAGYVRLKRDLVGGSDDLISVFENARHLHPAGTDVELSKSALFTDVCKRIADQVRRDVAIVQATAQRLGYVVTATPVSAGLLVTAPDFAQEHGIQRLWEALQVVERFGVPVASLLEWTRIVSFAATPEQRFEIARDVKEAIKARFEPETWQRVAQPIFDKLRQRQRDGLVAHVMHQHGFARMEQLYEYFLIDPGMEPVVQTSRIRLAIASVQLFIQRCLLNMELKVHPSVINSKQWEWMKCYQVWGANRKIFLFPENWLEPEFRDDKTHLFAELEGALLQGDVSSDLVEDAFLDYLKKLDELARLDIVAMHMEDNPDPARRTLHVIGRTYSQPHKYFYRRYAHQMWTPWEPVSAEIEGDHLAPVVWRDRLYLFWVTFMDKPAENAQPGPLQGSLVQARLADVMSAVKAAGKTKQIDVQLHWSEYLQGEWATGESSRFVPVTTIAWRAMEDSDEPEAVTADAATSFRRKLQAGRRIKVPLTVDLSFNRNDVFIHVAKEPHEDGEEKGVFVHLKGPDNFQHGFYLAGRNSLPEGAGYSPNPDSPYSASNQSATRYFDSGALKVSFQGRITTEGGKTPPKANPSILQEGSDYTLLPCDNDLTALGISEGAYLNAVNSAAVKDAIERGVGEIASLMKPVFYQDNAHTFFVEPSVTERTIEEWQGWVTPTPQPEPGWLDPDWWTKFVVIAELPSLQNSDSKGPRGGFPIGEGSLIKPKPAFDWLVNTGTGLLFDGVLIGPRGQPGLELMTVEVAASMPDGRLPININPGSGLAAGMTVVVSGRTTLQQNGLTQVGGGLNIVGSGGFNSALTHNLDQENRSGFGRSLSGAGRSER